MRARYLAVLLLPVPFSLAAAADAQAQVSRDSVITVATGRATRVAADRATFYVVVEGIAETPADAVARVQTKIGPVTEAIRHAAPEAQVGRPTAYGVAATANANGYSVPSVPPTNTARSVMKVQTDHPDQVALVVAAALAAGATAATGLVFDVSSADSLRRAHLPEVLAAARADAEGIATAMQGRLGALVDVSLTGSPVNPFPQSSSLVFDTRFTQPAPPPEMTVTTNVTVRYRLTR